METKSFTKIWDSEAEFDQIYKLYAADLSAYALKFVSSEAGRDIVQDIFLEIWRKPPIFKISIKSYLYAAVRNACLDHLKNLSVHEKYVDHRLRSLQTDEILYYQSGDVSILEDELLKLIYDAIRELPEKCRKIFEMCYYHDMNSTEIAKQLQISVRTVQNHLYKGLIKLRKIISKKTNNGVILFVLVMKKIESLANFEDDFPHHSHKLNKNKNEKADFNGRRVF